MLFADAFIGRNILNLRPSDAPVVNELSSLLFLRDNLTNGKDRKPAINDGFYALLLQSIKPI